MDGDSLHCSVVLTYTIMESAVLIEITILCMLFLTTYYNDLMRLNKLDDLVHIMIIFTPAGNAVRYQQKYMEAWSTKHRLHTRVGLKTIPMIKHTMVLN